MMRRDTVASRPPENAASPRKNYWKFCIVLLVK